MKGSALNTLTSIVCGAEAGAVGTLALDVVQYRHYREGGGAAAFPAWESSEGVDSWENAPAPALVAKRLLEAVLERDVPPRYARSLNNLMHWGFGVANGAVYGVLLGSRRSRIRYGIPFGAAVWANGYVILPLLGVYKPIWKYDRATLEADLRAHLVYGTITAVTFALLTTGEREGG
jgi:hypothetical protein